MLLVIFTLITSSLTYAFMEPILLFTGASERAIGYAADCLSIYLPGTLFVELSVGLNAFINIQGRPAIAMYSALIGIVLNIALDPLFVFTFGMGVKGAALATNCKLIEGVCQMMPVFLAGMTIFGLQRTCQNMFVALGQAKVSIFIALLRKVILLIPLALILAHTMGVHGFFAAEGISDATAAVCCTLIFASRFSKILR